MWISVVFSIHCNIRYVVLSYDGIKTFIIIYYYYYRSNSRGCTFYSLPWATTESPELLFDNFSFPLMVESNQELQIWFSEDLFRWGDSDNGLERTCVAVYGLYV